MAGLLSMSPYPRLPSSSRISLFLAASAASLGILVALRSVYGATQPPSPTVAESPRSTLIPKLSAEQASDLPYPPDVLPGSRDVPTPYGTIRVYEWGPEAGRRVLLVHGISTPCIALAGVAEGLVERGCRVMLFDLFGRGYTDAPLDLPYDARLYTTQILLVLASSALAWASPTAPFALVGYSLGGGIAAAFAASFPALVASLVLVAPAGLVRRRHVGWTSRLLYSRAGVLPEPLARRLVRRRLRGGPSGATAVTPAPVPAPAPAKPGDVDDPVSAELGGVAPGAAAVGAPPPPPSGPASFDAAPLFPARPLVTVAAAVRWQLEQHAGFVPAFVSSIRHGPIHDQHEDWRRVGARLAARRLEPGGAEGEGPRRSGKVLVVLGRTDPIILAEEIAEDAEACLGKEGVEIVVLEAGHEVPITKSRELVDAVWRFWGEDVAHEKVEESYVDIDRSRR